MSLEDIRLRVLPNRCRVQIGIGHCRAELTHDETQQLLRQLMEAAGQIFFTVAEAAGQCEGEAGRRRLLSDLSARRVEDRVLAMLTVAADAGRPCPTNAALAQTLGLPDANMVSVLVKRLETRGAIRVARQGYARQVVIAATGATTAPIRAAVRALIEPGKAPTARRKQG